MRRVPTYAALVAACMIVTAGCSGNATNNSGTGGSGSDNNAVLTPKPSGDVDKVVWNLPYGEPSSVDWTKAYSYSENTVGANLCEGLYRLTPDFKVVPALAESTSNPDPTTYVYKIRQGVTFWDGSPLTADDVVYSLNRHLDPAVSSLWGTYYDKVESIAKTAPDQVTVKLKEPDVMFDRWLATPAGTIGRADFIKAAGEKFGTADGGLMCTGPFKLQSWVGGKSITMTRNDAYWDQAHRAKAKTFEFSFVVDEAAATNALQAGEIDGTYDVPLSGLPQLRTGGAGSLWYGKTQATLSLLPTEKKSPLQDPKIRQALRLAIDYKGIVQQIYKGTASPLRAYVGPGTWGYAPDVYTAAYKALTEPHTDLDAARKLVQDAGAPKDEIVIAAVSDFPLYAQLATVVQDAGKKIGLNVRLQGFPTSTYTTFFFEKDARNQVDAFFTTNYTDIPEPLQMYRGFRPGDFYNYDGYDNPEVTKKLDEALRTTDDTARARLVTEAQARITTDSAVLPIVEPANRLFMSKRITGAPASFVYLYYPWAADVGAR
ncbi:ABC transporter substrate-binding protein [Embleya scabrispora]|uniref:ABC transporter substrate-binding protein n=1 Tax=Embleya scabrispora TaxID=159449 RepID=UPI0004780CAE|nr:ABC transporter substrate-binding protein [Embleya scabrispora]MYS80744.1 ABC transporter substrate-binding protein [Streptomyces sp. SID5474]